MTPSPSIQLEEAIKKIRILADKFVSDIAAEQIINDACDDLLTYRAPMRAVESLDSGANFESIIGELEQMEINFAFRYEEDGKKGLEGARRAIAGITQPEETALKESFNSAPEAVKENALIQYHAAKKAIIQSMDKLISHAPAEGPSMS